MAEEEELAGELQEAIERRLAELKRNASVPHSVDEGESALQATAGELAAAREAAAYDRRAAASSAAEAAEEAAKEATEELMREASADVMASPLYVKVITNRLEAQRMQKYAAFLGILILVLSAAVLFYSFIQSAFSITSTTALAAAGVLGAAIIFFGIYRVRDEEAIASIELETAIHRRVRELEKGYGSSTRARTSTDTVAHSSLNQARNKLAHSGARPRVTKGHVRG